MSFKYPPYACECCGYTNGDMFYDYFRSQHKKITKADEEAFFAYRDMWHEIDELRREIKALKGRDLMAKKVGRPIGAKKIKGN